MDGFLGFVRGGNKQLIALFGDTKSAKRTEKIDGGASKHTPDAMEPTYSMQLQSYLMTEAPPPSLRCTFCAP